MKTSHLIPFPEMPTFNLIDISGIISVFNEKNDKFPYHDFELSYNSDNKKFIIKYLKTN